MTGSLTFPSLSIVISSSIDVLNGSDAALIDHRFEDGRKKCLAFFASDRKDLPRYGDVPAVKSQLLGKQRGYCLSKLYGNAGQRRDSGRHSSELGLPVRA